MVLEEVQLAASKLAVQSLRQFLEQEAGDLDATLPFELRSYYSLSGNVLFNAVTYANEKVMKASRGKNWLEAGGASVLAGFLEGRLFALANVGACSVHLFRNGRSKEIVAPRTLSRQVNPFIEDHELGKGVPLMSLGTARQLEPEIIEIEIQPGDQLCLHTAGMPLQCVEGVFALQSPDQLKNWVNQCSQNKPIELNASLIWVSF